MTKLEELKVAHVAADAAWAAAWDAARDADACDDAAWDAAAAYEAYQAELKKETR